MSSEWARRLSHETLDLRNLPTQEQRHIMRKKKERKTFAWQEILEDKLYLAVAIAKKKEFSHLQLPAVRRYLRIGVATGRLMEVKFGRYKYYCTKCTHKKLSAP